MTAKDFLNRIRNMGRVINEKQLQIETLNDILTGTTRRLNADRVQTSDSDRRSTLLAKLVDLKDAVSADIEELFNLKSETAILINEIPDVNHRKLLTLRYLKCLRWDDIVDSFDYSVRRLYQLHGNALCAFEEIRNKKLCS